jgi:H+/Cl- antiporter ClcA
MLPSNLQVQIHAVSDDFKEISLMSAAQTARNIGIGVVTGLAGWLAGPVIARRLITKRPLLTRNIVRGAVFGGLCWVLALFPYRGLF